MARRVRHRGYVLVLALGLLVLASTLLVGVGRAAVKHALAAKEAQDELQRRWAVETCRAVLLPSVEQMLERQETLRKQPAVTWSSRVKLGSVTLDCLAADEQAKVNV